MSKPLNIFILGANRGIGLQLVKDIVATLNVNKLFATYRNEDQSKELLEYAASNPKVKTLQLDARDDSKFLEIAKKVEEEVQGQGLNLVINNAGVYTERPQRLESLTKETLLFHFEVNTVAPLLFTKAVLPLLETAANRNSTEQGINRAAIVNMSSTMGSIAENSSGGEYAYRSSKTALNMVNKSLSVDLKPKNILAVVLHPGWVITEMGGENALITVEESVRGMLNVISGLDDASNGKFYNYAGKELPW